jgi:cyanophycinase-like exopeptidase
VTRMLTLMGSGETAPTMVKVHRAIFEKMGDSAIPAKSLFLDTPFGFQENAAELCVKTLDYFASSIVRPLTVAGIGRIDTMSVAEREAAFSRLAQAAVIFAGPGSPTYTLKQWAPTPIRTILADKLRLGGALTFSSAAVLTLGAATVPVYEIYKAGEDPYWLEGLNVLAEVGINAAVIPHYNNAEGGHHDTRFCYLGERRLSVLEKSLAADHNDAYVLGLDEHTGVMIDLDAGSAQVVGLGVMTIRRNGVSVEIPTGTTLDLEVLIAGDAGASSSSTTSLAIGADGSAPSGDAPTLEVPAGSLAEEIDRCVLGFESALSTGDATAAATQALTLDDAIEMWSKDMLQSRDPERAKAALRSMIVRLGDAAVGGLRDPRETLGPVVEVALKARLEVRAAKRFDLSDLIRDGLADCGIEVRDTPQGQTWDLKAP